MSELNFVDRYSSTLASGYTSGGSTLTVTSASGLPTGVCNFYAIVAAEGGNTEEVFLVTNVSGTTLTVTGAQAGTSASNHTSSAVIIASIMTADAYRYFPQCDVLSETKPGGVVVTQKIENQTVSGGATQTLLSYSGEGYVSAMFIFMTNGSNFSDAAQSTTLKITVDGEGTGGTFNDRIPLFFGSEYTYNTVNHKSRFQGSQTNGSNNVGYTSYIPIPFSSSIVISVVNGAASNTQFWAHFVIHTDVPNNWPRTRKLRTSSGTLSNQTVDTVITLLDVSSQPPGKLLGVFMSVDSFPNTANPATAPLEGNVKMYLEGSGSPSFEAPGTEDYFMWSNYFEGASTYFTGGSGTGSYSMDLYHTGVQFAALTSSVTWNMYRWHILDQILFEEALKITWNCGDSTQVNFTGGVRLAYCVWYYTE